MRQSEHEPLSVRRSGKLALVSALIVLALTVGLADSVNPSTVGPALYLATGRDAPQRVLYFALGVFSVYLAGGIVLILGPGRAVLAVLHRPGAHTAHILELGLGLALALIAVGLWLARRRVATHLAQEENFVRRSSIAVGAAITAVELPTAFPYFAVIAAILGSAPTVPDQVVALATFNLAFVTPLVLIAATRHFMGERGVRALERVRIAFDRRAPALIPALVLVIATILVFIGALGLA